MYNLAYDGESLTCEITKPLQPQIKLTAQYFTSIDTVQVYLKKLSRWPLSIFKSQLLSIKYSVMIICGVEV